MAIYDFFLSRNNAASTPANYIGHKGRLFYNDADGLFRLSDGVTPGGKVVANLALASTGTTAPINPFSGELWYNPTTKELWAYYNGSFRGTINVATTTTLGGIKAGPGVVIASDGALSLDSTGIPFNFGDFYAFTNPGPSDGACLSSINLNQDVNLVSNGTGSVNVVGIFSVHTTNNDVESSLSSTPVFSVGNDGQTTIIVPTVDPTAGALRIIGSSSGQSQSTVNTGVMLHVTGNNGDASRIYNDGVGSFAAYVARRYNGTVSTSTAVLANEEIMRLSGTAHNGTGIPGTGNQRIIFRALGNQTPTNQGGSIEMWTTPVNTTTLAKVATVDSVDGITSTKFTGPLTGVATTATNLAAASNIVAGQTTINPTSVTRSSSSVQTFTINGLTTGHKILIMPATPLTFGIVITAAWPSAPNTVSIEFQNLNGNTDIDLGNIAIDYFAWI